MPAFRTRHPLRFHWILGHMRVNGYPTTDAYLPGALKPGERTVIESVAVAVEDPHCSRSR